MDKRNFKEADIIKILIVFPHEETRLVSVQIRPKSISVNVLLVELGIKLTPSMEARCVALTVEELDYVIKITDKSSNLQLPSKRVVPIQTNVPANNAVIQTKSNEILQAKAAPSHVPKYIEGFSAICDFCGFLSLDHAKCERCLRDLASPQRKPIRPPPIPLPAKSPAQTSTSRIVTRLFNSKAGQVKQPAPSVRPTSTPSSSARDGARKRKVLTSSSDDEDMPGNGVSCSKRGRPDVPLVKVLARDEVITPCPPCAVLKQEVTRLKCDKLDLLEHNTASHTGEKPRNVIITYL